jgi:hypothetical protein
LLADWTKFHSQTTHVCIDGPRTAIVLALPHVTENVCTAQNLVGVHNLEFQQCKFPTRQVDPDTIDENLDPVEPRMEVSAAVLPNRRLII